MKLQLVGTGSIGAVERSASTLIDDKILVDCGNGIVKTLKEQNVDIDNIKAILITHLHGDHFFDIPFLILTRTFTEVKNEIKVFCPVGTEERVKTLTDIAFGKYEERKAAAKIKFIEFEKLKNEEIIKDYYVDSKLVEHGSLKPAYGFILKHEGKTIGFSGDSSYCNSIEEIVMTSDVSVLDMSDRQGNASHMGIDDIQKIINKHGKKVIATHMQTKTRAIAKQKNIQGLIIQEDGDIVNI